MSQGDFSLALFIYGHYEVVIVKRQVAESVIIFSKKPINLYILFKNLYISN